MTMTAVPTVQDSAGMGIKLTFAATLSFAEVTEVNWVIALRWDGV